MDKKMIGAGLGDLRGTPGAPFHPQKNGPPLARAELQILLFLFEVQWEVLGTPLYHRVFRPTPCVRCFPRKARISKNRGNSCSSSQWGTRGPAISRQKFRTWPSARTTGHCAAG